MDILYSLAFSLVAIFNSIEISSASSPPRVYDFISQLEQRSEPSSHQASSSHPHFTGEGLAETELRLNTNPEAHSNQRGLSRTYMHFHLDPHQPSTIHEIPTDLTSQVHLNEQNIPSTMLKLKNSDFYFTDHFEYLAPVEYEQGPNGKWIPKTHQATPITPGKHRVVMNNQEEAVGYSYDRDYCSYIGYQGNAVALRWEHGELGVRILEKSERTYLKNL